LPAARIGEAYTVALQASGGAAPYSYFVQKGRLPRGLPLNAAGTIAGKPQLPGLFTFSIRSTDVNGVSVVQDYSITVLPRAKKPAARPRVR
jgi:hypothetical protein